MISYKYAKYKNKYLRLKQVGGDNCTKLNFKLLFDIYIKYQSYY